MSTTTVSNLFKDRWSEIENVETYPHYLRNIIIMDADEFVHRVSNADVAEVDNFVRSIYGGDAYLLRNAFTVEFVEETKDKIINWATEIEDNYCEMLDGVSSYRFTNYGNRRPEGGYTEVVHSSVFFRWDDVLGLFKHFDKYWDAFKILSGQSPDAYKNNNPSDGIIDRITLMQYPLNHGKITHHYDSPRKQKLLLGGIFSQIGEDYDIGENGFYLVDKDERKYFLENLSRKGDLLCAYPAMYHGVPCVKKRGAPSADLDDFLRTKQGRFYLQCFSAESHEVQSREFAVAIQDEAGHGPIANYIGENDNE